MAIANLQETLLMYTLRKSDLLEEISKLNSQKNIALAEQADVNSLLNANTVYRAGRLARARLTASQRRLASVSAGNRYSRGRFQVMAFAENIP